MAVTIDPTNTTYEMAELRLDSEVIYANEFNIDIGEDGGDPKTVTNSRDPVRYARSKNTYEWGASGIEPEYYDFLIQHKLNKTLFPINALHMSPDGKYKAVGNLKYAKITEVNYSYGDDGTTIDVSGNALKFELAK